ncbi:hypothetical protein UY3_02319 [Chelonia mydas]|uniref:Peptidase C19 ubiquitin carboxyl-terminal hydrolase domain-containing protein n=1 Tax=Chelonia mydas TaxID=8469 RepID=M7BX98_CHEMY|nr:hypothetical protein UY3_02319 [Chelonia mydas]
MVTRAVSVGRRLETVTVAGLSTLPHGVDLRYRNFSYVNSVAEVDVLRSTYHGVFTVDTVYELFVVCHHSGGIQGDQYMVEIKSVENDCWYRFTETQVQELQSGGRCTDGQFGGSSEDPRNRQQIALQSTPVLYPGQEK